MEKAYNIKDVRFEDESLIIILDDQIVTLTIANISEKLAKATSEERNEFKISPSGYGIHWPQLDEDLSVNGFLQANELHKPLHHSI